MFEGLARRTSRGKYGCHTTVYTRGISADETIHEKRRIGGVQPEPKDAPVLFEKAKEYILEYPKISLLATQEADKDKEPSPFTRKMNWLKTQDPDLGSSGEGGETPRAQSIINELAATESCPEDLGRTESDTDSQTLRKAAHQTVTTSLDAPNENARSVNDEQKNDNSNSVINHERAAYNELPRTEATFRESASKTGSSDVGDTTNNSGGTTVKRDPVKSVPAEKPSTTSNEFILQPVPKRSSKSEHTPPTSATATENSTEPAPSIVSPFVNSDGKASKVALAESPYRNRPSSPPQIFTFVKVRWYTDNYYYKSYIRKV